MHGGSFQSQYLATAARFASILESVCAGSVRSQDVAAAGELLNAILAKTKGD